jgi:hypothetical protein
MTDNFTHQRAIAGGQWVKAQDQDVSPHQVKSSGVTVRQSKIVNKLVGCIMAQCNSMG